MVSKAVQESWDKRDEARKNFKKSEAKPSQPTEKPTLYSDDFVRFINFKPNDTQKELYNEWIQTADIWGLVDRLGDDGFKLTVKYDEVTKAFNALLMERRKAHPMQGCILSVRASEMSVSIARLVFVHTALAGKDWENLDVPTEDTW